MDDALSVWVGGWMVSKATGPRPARRLSSLSERIGTKERTDSPGALLAMKTKRSSFWWRCWDNGEMQEHTRCRVRKKYKDEEDQEKEEEEGRRGEGGTRRARHTSHPKRRRLKRRWGRAEGQPASQQVDDEDEDEDEDDDDDAGVAGSPLPGATAQAGQQPCAATFETTPVLRFLFKIIQRNQRGDHHH